MDITISDCRKLVLKLFVIGYSEGGESLVLFFKDGLNNNVIYTIVVDSYKLSDGTFKTAEILKSNNVDNISILVWTHPDLDHSAGLKDLVTNYCNKKSEIFIPYYIDNAKNLKLNSAAKDIADTLLEMNTPSCHPVKPIGLPSNCKIDLNRIRFADLSGNEVNTTIIFYAPHSDFIFLDKYQKRIAPNNLSIFMEVVIGPYKFEFSGDVENRSINNMNVEPFKCPFFFKIPHHSSKSSNSIFNHLEVNKNSHFCTTTYQKQRLPNMDVLMGYKNKSKYVYSTGIDNSGKVNFGIVEYTYNLFDKKEVHIKCHGHAHKA